jgi:phospholipid transport system substrate-binding protein
MKSANGARKWWIGVCLSVLLGVALIRPGWAGAPTDQLKGSVDHVIRILDDPRLKSASMEQERRVAIRKEADAIFDFAESAKRALGPHWQRLSDADRQEFVSLYADLLQRAYISKIERYSGEKITGAETCRSRHIKTRSSPSEHESPWTIGCFATGDRWFVMTYSRKA